MLRTRRSSVPCRASGFRRRKTLTPRNLGYSAVGRQHAHSDMAAPLGDALQTARFRGRDRLSYSTSLLVILMNTTDMAPALARLFSELVDGASGEAGAFILNSGDAGLLR